MKLVNSVNAAARAGSWKPEAAQAGAAAGLIDDRLPDAVLDQSQDQAGGRRVTSGRSMLGERVLAVLERALEVGGRAPGLGAARPGRGARSTPTGSWDGQKAAPRTIRYKDLEFRF